MNRSNLFLIAIVSGALTLLFFLAFLSQTDLFGQTRGPVWLMVVGLITGVAAVMASVTWFMPSAPVKEQEENAEKSRTGPRTILCGVLLGLNILFCGVMVFGCLSEINFYLSRS